MIKRKFYLEKIVKLIDTEDIKVITGVRRCGKTVLLKQIIDELENRGIASENIIYMSFESSKYKNIRNILQRKWSIGNGSSSIGDPQKINLFEKY